MSPPVNPWIVAVAVMFATFMEVLDTTVVNVSLPHIASSMSATTDEATWALTSYLVANAIILPMTGWLAARFGRKRLLMMSTAGFTLASFLCGIAQSMSMLILFRAIQGAVATGAFPIIGVDVLDSKLALARDFGATHTFNVGTVDAVAEIMRLTGGGADASVVAVGDARAMEQGLEVLAKQGIEVLVGVPPTGSTLQIPPGLLVQGERRIVGSRYGSGNPQVEFPKMVELAMAGRLRIADLVTKRYDIDEADEAFRALAAGEQARGLIVF
jgi:hypothetical protein